MFSVFFFFNDTATTEIYTLSLHDALPISRAARSASSRPRAAPRLSSILATFAQAMSNRNATAPSRDRKSTRLNSSHLVISYAVFCLKKKKNILIEIPHPHTPHPTQPPPPP